jgi:hypothetical protein
MTMADHLGPPAPWPTINHFPPGTLPINTRFPNKCLHADVFATSDDESSEALTEEVTLRASMKSGKIDVFAGDGQSLRLVELL